MFNGDNPFTFLIVACFYIINLPLEKKKKLSNIFYRYLV